MNQNKKTLIITLSIFIVALIICLFIFLPRKENKTTTIFHRSSKIFSLSQEFSLEIPKKLDLQTLQKDPYILYLQSDHLLIRAEKTNRFFNKSLLEITEADRETYISQFQDHDHITEISSLEINQISCYLYSFDFLYQTLSLTSHNISFEKDDMIYSLEFIFDANAFKNANETVNEILSTLQLY